MCRGIVWYIVTEVSKEFARLRHEQLSTPTTMGSWVPIPLLEAWTAVCAALRRADPPSEESYRLRIRLGNCKVTRKGCRPIELKGMTVGKWLKKRDKYLTGHIHIR
jgi:hypothetical protein